MLLSEGQQITDSAPPLKGQPDSVRIQASLSLDGLSLTDTLNNSLDFLLSNRYPVTESYPETSLYAELLLYDIDSDGQDEIWIAINDRCYLTLRNHYVVYNQNYVADWCIYCDESGNFQLAEGQLFTELGNLEIDQVISGGIWIEQTFEAYLLKDGALTYLP